MYGKSHIVLLTLLLSSATASGGVNEDLLAAVDRGETARVRALLASGAHADVANQHGSTALMIASERGFLPIVQLLLSSGADPHATNKEGTTALMGAAHGGHADVVQLLAGRKVDINAHERC